MKLLQRIAVTLVTVAVVLGGFWIGGFDFDRRGEAAAFVYLMTLLFAALSWFAPWWD